MLFEELILGPNSLDQVELEGADCIPRLLTLGCLLTKLSERPHVDRREEDDPQCEGSPSMAANPGPNRGNGQQLSPPK